MEVKLLVSEWRNVHHVLVANQKNYQKYPPNSIIQRLYGSSVLTQNGDEWKRHRLLMHEVFSRKHIAGFHHIFVAHSEQLAAKWGERVEQSESSLQLNIYPSQKQILEHAH